MSKLSFSMIIFTIVMLNIWRVLPSYSIRGFLACIISFGLIGFWWKHE